MYVVKKAPIQHRRFSNLKATLSCTQIEKDNIITSRNKFKLHMILNFYSVDDKQKDKAVATLTSLAKL